MRSLLTVALLLSVVSTPVLAHGGQYKGPSDAGGGASAGGNSAPPTNPGGAAAPGPGAPASGGAGTAGGTSGGRTRGDSQRGGTTGGAIELATNYETWEFWWENNKDQYLNLKSRVVKNTSAQGSAGSITGRGRQADARNTKRPSLELINTEVLPTLAGLVKSGDKRDIIDSAILAMSRAAQADSADLVINAATPLLAHKELSVQTAAALSLGIMGSPKALPSVTALMTNSAEGRKLVGGGDVPQLVRAFGALSQGLIDDPSSVKSLVDIIENTKDSERDIKVTAIVALGLMSNNNTSRNEAYQYLVKKLGDEKLDSIIASYIPTSLGKLGNVEAVPALLKVLVSKDTDVFVRQSAIIGLGQLASLGQADVIKALKEYIAEGKDQQARHFCFISLAQIGRRAAIAGLEGVDPVHAELVKLFGDEIKKPTSAPHRSWAALAAAIYTQKYTEGQPQLVERIREAWEKENDLSFKSAFGLALGLLHIDDMGKKLFDDFTSTRDPDHKGYTAVALGFLSYTDAADALRAQCQIKSATPTYRLQVATGLGLMGDAQAVATLVETLQTAETLGVSSAVAKALGLIGDTEAVGPLKDIALDTKKQDIVRAFACVALGIVCEKTDLPWNARISANNNYRARVPAIDEVLDIL